MYDLIVRVFRLDMRYLCFMNFVHVIGTIMIQQGTYGLYIGDMFEVILNGESMFYFIALHKGYI